MDELTTTTGSDAVLAERGGRFERLRIEPDRLGLPLARLADLVGGSPEENARTTQEILAGAPGPRRDIVLLNAAAALWVVEAVSGLEEGLARAARSIDEGAAAARLEALQKATAQAGPR
jgi:anthranilate phosphoribosyltransferase